jgi:hypothetical protein
LGTKLLTNAIQGIAFSVAWKYLSNEMNKKKKETD